MWINMNERIKNNSLYAIEKYSHLARAIEN
jgi:hypothetical protein